MAKYVYKIAKNSLKHNNNLSSNISTRDIRIGIYLHIYQICASLVLIAYFFIKNNI